MLNTQTKSEELKGSGKRFHVRTLPTASVCTGQITLCSALPWNSALPISEARTERVLGMFWFLSDMRRFANPLLSALALCEHGLHTQRSTNLLLPRFYGVVLRRLSWVLSQMSQGFSCGVARAMNTVRTQPRMAFPAFLRCW